MDWDLFRTFEHVARAGTLSGAATHLGMSQPSVSRRIARLEDMCGSPLFVRSTPLTLTPRGRALLDALAGMSEIAVLAEATLRATPEPEGVVTLATVGELVRWVLLPRLNTLVARHPRIRLRVLADNRVHNLATGEADLAVRMVLPKKGDLIARRLWGETYGFFAHHLLPRTEQTPWLSTTGTLADIADQAHAKRVFAGRPPALEIEDFEGLGLAVQAGLGVAALPRSLASTLEGVVEVAPTEVGGRDVGTIPERHAWLVVHRSRVKLPAVRAVMEWLESIAAELRTQ